MRQIEKRLESWPEISFARIAGELGVHRDTVRRIANGRYRPARGQRLARCPGCGGKLKKRGATCQVCPARLRAELRRLVRTALSPTESILRPAG